MTVEEFEKFIRMLEHVVDPGPVCLCAPRKVWKEMVKNGKYKKFIRRLRNGKVPNVGKIRSHRTVLRMCSRYFICDYTGCPVVRACRPDMKKKQCYEQSIYKDQVQWFIALFSYFTPSYTSFKALFREREVAMPNFMINRSGDPLKFKIEGDEFNQMCYAGKLCYEWFFNTGHVLMDGSSCVHFVKIGRNSSFYDNLVLDGGDINEDLVAIVAFAGKGIPFFFPVESNVLNDEDGPSTMKIYEPSEIISFIARLSLPGASVLYSPTFPSFVDEYGIPLNAKGYKCSPFPSIVNAVFTSVREGLQFLSILKEKDICTFFKKIPGPGNPKFWKGSMKTKVFSYDGFNKRSFFNLFSGLYETSPPVVASQVFFKEKGGGAVFNFNSERWGGPNYKMNDAIEDEDEEEEEEVEGETGS